MSRDEQDRLRDIKEAIAAIREHLERVNKATPRLDDPLLHDALLFQFVIIGEAVKHLTPEARDSEPGIPWANIAGLRDLIAHEYFRIDIHRVLEIVERDVPALEQAVDRMLDKLIDRHSGHLSTDGDLREEVDELREEWR